MINYFIFFFLSLCLTYFFTILAKNLAPYIGAIDKPNNIKIHNKPIARLGGLAIYLSFLISMILVHYFDERLIIFSQKKTVGFVIGGTIVFIAGLIDDIFTIKAIYKLIIQSISATILYYTGIRMNFFPNLLISYFFTLVYVVGSYSAMDMIDGMDGLASGLTSICSIFFLIVFWQNQHIFGIFLSIILLGSSLGFFVHNFHPAKIFMGDGGSMLLGFILATLMIIYTDKHYDIVGLVIPILIFAVPIIDNLITFLFRYKQGKSFLVGDLNHFYNRIMSCGVSYRKTVFVMYIFSIIFGISAILLTVNMIAGIASTFLSGLTFFYFNRKIQLAEKKQQI